MGIILQHPLGVVCVAVLGAGLSLLLTATHLTFHSDRLELIASGEYYKQLDLAYNREFTELPERVIVVIRNENPEKAKAFATALGQRWESDPNIDSVFYRIDAESLKRKALLYLSPDDLIALREKLQQHQGLLAELSASPTLQTLFALINREMTTALMGHAFTEFLEEEGKQHEPLDLGMLLALLRQLDQWLDGARAYHSPWEAFLTKDGEAISQDGFLRSEDKQFLFVLANPKKEAGQFNRFEESVGQMQADVRELRRAYPDVEVGITGSAVLDADEMGVAQRDTAIATGIAIVGVALLYFGLFRGVVRPLLALATLGIGICWTLGLTTLTIGHLNVLSIVFMPMLVGLGIDYGSFFIARYEEERAAGAEVRDALVRTFVATGPGIGTTALATALTFGTLLLTAFKGLAELGFIGSSGMLLAVLATFTVLPALLVLDERRRRRGTGTQARLRDGSHGGYLEPLYRHPRATLAASVFLAGLALLALGRVGADFNLLHLQAQGTESVAWLRKIFASEKRSVLFGELVAESAEEVARKEAALKAMPSVAEVESIASVIPADQERKRPLIDALRPLLADVAFRGDKAESVDLDALRAVVGRIAFKVGEASRVVEDSEPGGLRAQLLEVRRLSDGFVARAERMGNAEVSHALAPLQAELFRDLGEKLALLKASLRAEPVTLADLPPELHTRYVGKTGKYRLFVFPSEDIWEFQPLARFVADLRSVDPDALGTPVMQFEFIAGIKEAYEKAGLYALLGIVFLAFLIFRAVRPMLLALIPLAVGSLWAAGLMGLFGVKINVANLIVLPLIMAPAIESGIMIVYRYREESGRVRTPVPLPKSTGRAVAFSALSTIVGFGSLMISRHWGIFSIGLLLTIGVGSVLLAALAVLPSLLTLLSARGRKGDLPRDLWQTPGDHRVLTGKWDVREAVGTGANGNTRVISRLKRPKASWARDLLLALGLVIFVGLIWQIGFQRILSYLQPLGWKFVLVFLPFLPVVACDTLGWRYGFERTPPLGFLRFMAMQIAGKAVNAVTPLLPVGGEPIKAHLLQTHGVPLAEGLASVVISTTASAIALGLFVLAVTGFLFAYLGLPIPLLKAIGSVLLIGVVLVGAFVFAQTRGLFGGLLGMARRLKLGLSLLEEGARDLDRTVAGYYRHRRGRFALAVAFNVLGSLVEGLEAYVLLMLLELPRSPVVAIGIVALSSAVRAASFMVPGNLGVQEGGNVVIFLSFGLPPDAAMAFSILRRIRELGWSAAGLLFLSLSRLRTEQRVRLASASAERREPGEVVWNRFS